jgi:hypothetical protein
MYVGRAVYYAALKISVVENLFSNIVQYIVFFNSCSVYLTGE